MKFPLRLRTLSVRTILFVAALALFSCWLLSREDVPRAAAQSAPGGYKNFEAPQIHPLAMTPDGTRLLAVNTPNATLSVFQLTGGVPVLTAEIPVGLEPSSVAARNNREAWVVNWLSDSVSVVDLTTGNVTRTLDVGDEPTDVLFAGQGNERAFVCVSGTSQVRVYNASAPTATPQVIDIRGKQPRSLARDAAGTRVFVSVFESGNQTAIVPANQVAAGGGLPAPQPGMAGGLPAAPLTGLIVKWNGSGWMDERGDTRWTNFLPFRLADVDVVALDTSGASVTVAAELRGVGTHVGNAVHDAASNRLFVVNTDSRNFTRFEPNLRGHFVSTRVSKIDLGSGGSAPFDLNSHIDYASPAGSDAERANSLALPADIARASDGTLYVAATGSAKVGVVNSSGAVTSRIGVGQGPTGLALDEARARLYVLNRFDETLSVVDTGAQSETARIGVGFNPEPDEVRAGRRFLYGAEFSAHGDVSCASCHLNGHRDGLAWDLGDPQGQMQRVFNPGGLGGIISPLSSNFHPMKGPMTTQSLRGINGTEPLHWRGDRSSLSAFNPAFVSLLGGTRQLDGNEMASFETFVRTLVYPPNPLQNLDRTTPTTSPSGANAQRGQQLFNTARLDAGLLTCNQCHTASPSGVGTNGIFILAAALQEPQDFKVPQLRGLYQKLGRANAPGEQLTGFGFIHDGSFDNLVSFLRSPVFNFTSDADRRDVAQFVLAFDTGTAPAVGLQATVNAENRASAATLERVSLLIAQANARNCDLVVRGLYKGVPRGFVYRNAAPGFEGLFESDRAGEPQLSKQTLLDAVEAGAELTFTGVPVGTGRRFGVDRDGDAQLNGDAPLRSIQISGRVVGADGTGIAGVTLALTGTQTATTQTDAAGRFLFSNLSVAGTHVITPAGSDFAPASRTFTNPTWHQTAYFAAPASANAIDSPQFFVAQHYRDFLNREPDSAGLDFWTNQMTNCGNPDLLVCRINVSASFFVSIEFQETGYLVYRLYKTTHARLPRFAELLPDTQTIASGVVVGKTGWQQQLETNKQSFFNAWVNRPAFQSLYDTKSNAEYVDTLYANAGVAPSAEERNALVNGLNANTETRATVLRKVAENETLRRNELNRAFVLMQYFGYLRRDADDAGLDFWLGKLNEFGGNYVNAEMVKAFLISSEYRGRFGQ